MIPTKRIWEMMLMISVMMVIMVITTTMTRQKNVRDDVEDGGEGLFITKFRWRSLLGVTMWPTYYNFLMYSHQHFQKLHSMLLKAKKDNWWCCCPGKTHTLPIIKIVEPCPTHCSNDGHFHLIFSTLRIWTQKQNWIFWFDVQNCTHSQLEFCTLTPFEFVSWCMQALSLYFKDGQGSCLLLFGTRTDRA